MFRVTPASLEQIHCSSEVSYFLLPCHLFKSPVELHAHMLTTDKETRRQTNPCLKVNVFKQCTLSVKSSFPKVQSVLLNPVGPPAHVTCTTLNRYLTCFFTYEIVSFQDDQSVTMVCASPHCKLQNKVRSYVQKTPLLIPVSITLSENKTQSVLGHHKLLIFCITLTKFPEGSWASLNSSMGPSTIGGYTCLCQRHVRRNFSEYFQHQYCSEDFLKHS